MDLIGGNKGISAKNCGCNYKGTQNGYLDEVKRGEIRYLEWMGFRRIERLMRIGYVLVNELSKKISQSNKRGWKNKNINRN